MCYYKFLRKHADKRRDLHFSPMSAMHVFFPIAMMTCGQNSVYPKFVLNHYMYHLSWKFIGWWSEHSFLSPLIERVSPTRRIHHGAHLSCERTKERVILRTTPKKTKQNKVSFLLPSVSPVFFCYFFIWI